MIVNIKRNTMKNRNISESMKKFWSDKDKDYLDNRNTFKANNKETLTSKSFLLHNVNDVILFDVFIRNGMKVDCYCL